MYLSLCCHVPNTETPGSLPRTCGARDAVVQLPGSYLSEATTRLEDLDALVCVSRLDLNNSSER